MYRAKYSKRYYVLCKILKTVLCMVPNIKNGIMHGAKKLKTVLCMVQNIKKGIMHAAKY